MTKKQLENYKEILLQERQNVIEELAESDESVRDLIDDESHNVNDFVDEASSKITQNILAVMSKNHKQKMMAIEAALRRIAESSFGVCVSCGSKIELERLDSIPWTTMCISCKVGNNKKN
jgi:RNA polymerase-binding protein DksA